VLQEPDLDTLNQVSQAIANQLRTIGLLANVRTSYEVTKPELRVHIDRDRAATLGVSVETISRSLQVLFGGLDLSQIKVGGKEYDVIAQLERTSRLTPADLDRLYVRSDRGRPGAAQQRGALRGRAPAPPPSTTSTASAPPPSKAPPWACPWAPWWNGWSKCWPRISPTCATHGRAKPPT
jgi:hypothetical protein